MSDEMTRLDEIAARREDPGNRELIDGGCEGAGEYGGCHDASVLIEAMDADLAVLLAVVREVAALHQTRTFGIWEGYCACSGREWPCPTARALEALTVTEETTT